MRGETLYPLNALEELHPDVYARESAKYAGRETVPRLRIPLLDVLWNDALHLAPIHPYHLAVEWSAAGLRSPTWQREFFAIPVDRLAAERAVWFAYDVYGSSSGDALPPADFTPFDPDAYEELMQAPPAYREYLLERKETGRRLLHFPFVPHVLVAAPVDTSGLVLVRADVPPR